MIHKHAHAGWSEASDASYSTSSDGSSEDDASGGESAGVGWSLEEVRRYVQEGGKCVIVLDGFVVDVTSYLGEHVRLLVFLVMIYLYLNVTLR